mmetsp:Transcript_25988/g.34093  ORF Transcript_25988/g.34093 Transcript_25988/m.34093 type:complete len:316 (+) Transcript_25988:106-1053(+)
MPDFGLEESETFILGICFFLLAALSLLRLCKSSRKGRSAQIVQVFFLLILLTAILRAAYFLLPVEGLRTDYPGIHLSLYTFIGCQLVLCAGTLSFFAIFILIVVSWAEILRKVMKDGTKAKDPVQSCLFLSSCIGIVQVLNLVFVWEAWYPSAGGVCCGMFLYVLISCICLVELNLFSYRFRHALETLGAINQVSTGPQIRRICIITAAGNAFFLIRAVLEATVGLIIYIDLKEGKQFESNISEIHWDMYKLVAHGAELALLFILMKIFQINSASKGLSMKNKHKMSISQPPETLLIASRISREDNNDSSYGTLH